MTIETLFDSLTKFNWRKRSITWPPDVFALSATALLKSGAYLSVVEKWPPAEKRYRSHSEWRKEIEQLANQWRGSCLKERKPRPVTKWWNTILAARKLPLSKLSAPKNQKVCDALLSLCVSADAASAGIGVTRPRKTKKTPSDPFLEKAYRVAWQHPTESGHVQTVCSAIHTDVVRVLPKLHTPQSGITIRSLSHHLALCLSGEVEPNFISIPATYPKAKTSLNLLLVPWPLEVVPSDFRPSPKAKPHRLNPPGFANFTFQANGGAKWNRGLFDRILRASQKFVDTVDGVILPELCFNSDEEVSDAWASCNAILPETFLFCGASLKDGTDAINSAVCIFNPLPSVYIQHKHHAWSLNEPQLRQYSLCGQLDPKKIWWEDTKLKPRKLNFFSLSDWFTICCLICEDLARQDPVAELVRNVGPNLVVALLMDGPQLTNRWAARYASVLADDPGCSVLTFSSLGMVRRSRAAGKPESRVFALWKDSLTGDYPIELPHDADAAILNLALKPSKEYSADGRSDGACTGNWILQGVHFVRGS